MTPARHNRFGKVMIKNYIALCRCCPPKKKHQWNPCFECTQRLNLYVWAARHLCVESNPELDPDIKNVTQYLPLDTLLNSPTGIGAIFICEADKQKYAFMFDNNQIEEILNS